MTSLSLRGNEPPFVGTNDAPFCLNWVELCPSHLRGKPPGSVVRGSDPVCQLGPEWTDPVGSQCPTPAVGLLPSPLANAMGVTERKSGWYALVSED